MLSVPGLASVRDHPEAVLLYRTTSSGPKEGVPQLRFSKQRAAQECALLPHPTLLLLGKQVAAYSARRCLLHLSELPRAEHICLPRAGTEPQEVVAASTGVVYLLNPRLYFLSSTPSPKWDSVISW